MEDIFCPSPWATRIDRENTVLSFRRSKVIYTAHDRGTRGKCTRDTSEIPALASPTPTRGCPQSPKLMFCYTLCVGYSNLGERFGFFRRELQKQLCLYKVRVDLWSFRAGLAGLDVLVDRLLRT